MEYSKEDLMEAKKQIWGVGENMGTEESKKIWEENAQFWDNAMGDESNEFHREVVRPKVTELLSPNPADYILDIACGNGNYSSYLAQRGASVVAFDYSKKMIELAKRRQSQYAKQIEFCVADATDRKSILELKRKLDIRKKDYEQFWIASPVMMWAQMAQYSTLEELAAIGASLMSRDKRRRMATRKDFDTYLEISPRFIGRNKCHEALPYMTENTDSPPENTLFGMLKDSGLGCPTANYRVNIGNSYVILDMAYPDCRVAFEYQGAYHADPAQMRIDAAKRNALQLLGWIVILVTADDLRTADTRHRFIEIAHVVVSRQRNLADWNRSWAITS